MIPKSIHDWNTYAGGTGEHHGRNSYSIRGDFGYYSIQPTSKGLGRAKGPYIVQFADEKGLLGKGLWSQLGESMRRSDCVKLCQDHFRDVIQPIFISQKD